MEGYMIGTGRNTLAGQLTSRPLNMFRDISQTPVREFCAATMTYHNWPMATPHLVAARFYLLEHAVGTLRSRLMPGDVLAPQERALMEEYNSFATDAALRAAHYLFLICCRESRHAFPSDKDGKKAFAEKMPAGLWLTEGGNLLCKFPDLADVDAVCAVIRNDCGDARWLGQITKFLVATFFNAKFNNSYGGPKWGVVANCLNEFVHGRTTAAMMLDTVWTLEHNTSNIFNKGMLYHDAGSCMRAVLDAQRAGLIPRLFAGSIGGAESHGYYGLPSLVADKTLGDCFKRLSWLGGEFKPGGSMDWAKLKGPDAHELKCIEPEWCATLFGKNAPPPPPTATAAATVSVAPGVNVQKKARA
jgi:hypothetical protein